MKTYTIAAALAWLAAPTLCGADAPSATETTAPAPKPENIEQAIAEELFDSAVNCGMVTTIKWLQRALNVFNLQGADYPDMIVDGYMGKQTLQALDVLYKKRGPDIILKALNAQQGMHYIEIAEKNPTLERFEAGWWTKRIG